MISCTIIRLHVTNIITDYVIASDRDGMVKRPGNESYLLKVVEEERKAYSAGLEVLLSPIPSEEGDELQSRDDDNVVADD